MQYGSPQGPAQYAMMPQSPAPKKTKKRLAVVAAVSAACLASAGVYATSLTVTAKNDSAGSVVVASCDTTVEAKTGLPEWDETGEEFIFTSITITGIDPAECDLQTVFVQPTDDQDVAIGAGGSVQFNNGAANTDTTATVTGLSVPVADYDKVAVVIHES